LELEEQDIGSLEERISVLKKCLIDVAREREFTDPVVLAVSQHLDRLINQYFKTKQNVREKSPV